jgi:hypothetical protein
MYRVYPCHLIMYNILICSFLLSRGIGEPKYMPIHTWEALNKILTDALRNYNELNAAMDLVS